MRVKLSTVAMRTLRVCVSAGFRAAILAGMLHAGIACAEDEAWRALNERTLSLYNLSRFDEAAISGIRALDYAERQFGQDHATTVISLNNLAASYWQARRTHDAINLYERGLSIYERTLGASHPKTNDQRGTLADSFRVLGDYAKELPLREQVLNVTEAGKGPNHSDTSTALDRLAVLHKLMGQYPKALPLALRALAISEAADGPMHRNTGARLNNLATIYEAMGLYDKALATYLRALTVTEKTNGPEHPDTGASLANLSSIYQKMGQHDKALPVAVRALSLMERRKGKEHADVAPYVTNLAAILMVLGRYDEAEGMFRRALSVSETTYGPEHPSTGTAVNNMSFYYRTTGQFDLAVKMAQRALAIGEKALGPEHPSVEIRLSNLSFIYQAMGQYKEALPLSERALLIASKALGSDHPRVAICLTNLATIKNAQGKHGEAIVLLERAVSVTEKAYGADHLEVSASRSFLANLHYGLGHHEAALPHAIRALDISERAVGHDNPYTITARNNLAMLYRSMQRIDKAVPLSRMSYASAFASGVTLPMFNSAKTAAWIHASAGDTDAAILFGKQAVNLWQGIRSRSDGGLSEQQRKGLFESEKPIYRDLATWLIKAGRLAEAEQVMALLKSQELSDLLRRTDTGAQALSLTGQERPLLTMVNGLSNMWVAKAQELAALEAKRSAERSPAETQRLEMLRTERLQWNAQLQQWLSKLQGNLKAGTEGDASRVDQSRKSGHMLQSLVASTPGAAMGLQYVVTGQSMSIIVHTKSASTWTQSPIAISAIREQVARFRAVLDNPVLDPLPAAQELYKTLLAPVEAALKLTAPQTLILNLDDVLRYVPFSALHDGNQYLAERMAIALHTSAGGSSIRPQQGTQWRVAGLGVSAAVSSFPALPAVTAEIQGIVKTKDNQAGLIPGLISMNQDFNEESLRDILKDQFPVLHIATHFHFQVGSEFGSYLLLGDGKGLSLASIKNMNFNGVQLLALSACDTAKGGGRKEDGEEVEGLASAVQQRGAQSVMASLWPVADTSTALLMREFYRLRTLADSGGTAKALQAAQLSLLKGRFNAGGDQSNRKASAHREGPQGDSPVFVQDPSRPFAHPHFWAPFIVMGNWL